MCAPEGSKGTVSERLTATHAGSNELADTFELVDLGLLGLDHGFERCDTRVGVVGDLLERVDDEVDEGGDQTREEDDEDEGGADLDVGHGVRIVRCFDLIG